MKDPQKPPLSVVDKVIDWIIYAFYWVCIAGLTVGGVYLVYQSVFHHGGWGSGVLGLGALALAVKLVSVFFD